MKPLFVKHYLVFAALLSAATLQALTPRDLQILLERGEKLTIVDVRSTSEYQVAHIPGALNIPSSLISAKTLPPLGRVIVYGDGFGGVSADVAATELSKKPGIKAETLEGGFAAWETINGNSTRKGGVSPEQNKFLTYEQLQKAQGPDVILVDLRKPGASKASGASKTDLKSAFPKVAGITSSPQKIPASRQTMALSKTVAPLLVLIDDGDGEAELVARNLRASGNKRVAVLAGGEEILARQGKSGLQRSGFGDNSPVSGAQK